jgi:ABC-2 type transport system permease protein
MAQQNRMNKYYKFGAYLLVVILVNVAGVTLFVRADLTSDNIYSLSEASKTAVSALNEPLTINVFFTQNLPAPHNNTERYLHDLLEEYSIHSNKYFNYRFYDVSADEGDIDESAKRNQEMARNYGINPVQIQNIEQDEVKFQNAYMGMVMIHGDVVDKIPTITSTEDLEYQITSKIEKMNNKISVLLGMDTPVQLKLFFSSSLETVAPQLRMNGLMDIPGKVEEMVGRLNDKYYGKLAFSQFDPAANPAWEQAADEYNVLTLQWPSLKDRAGNETVPPGRGSAGLVVARGDKFQSIPLIRVVNLPLFGTQYQMTDLGELEKQIGEVIDDVIGINKKIGYLTSHGTLPLRSGMPNIPGMQQPQQENLGNFNKLVSNDYSILDVDLKDEAGIPDGIDCLILGGPKEPFNDYELFQIDQFLMKGKSLALFLDPYIEVKLPQNQMQYNRQQQPIYRPVNTDIEKLLEYYGLTIEKSYVMDINCFEQRIPQAYGGGTRQLYFAPMIKNEKINEDLVFMKNIKGLIMLLSAPVKLLNNTLSQNGLMGDIVFSSSPESWTMSGRIDLNPWSLQPPADQTQLASQPLAVLVQGEFPSYFAGRGIPEKPAKAEPEEDAAGLGADPSAQSTAAAPAENAGADSNEFKDFSQAGALIKKGGPGKIFLIGSSEILKNNVIDEQGSSTNATFVLNVLDELNNRNEYAEMRSKSQRFNPLGDTGPGLRTFVKTFNIAGLPIIVVVFGVFVWVRRNARKRTIEAMFNR